jgi:F0F1-type ATP synthase assembly protein I
MTAFVVKVLVSALLIAAAAEFGRRSALAGAILASLPLTSILAMVWLWRDGAAPAQIADFSAGVLWFVLPSLLLFIVTPSLLRAGWSFWPSLGAGCAATAAGYGLGVAVVRLLTSIR